MKKFLFSLASAVCMTASAALSTTDFSSNDYIGEWGALKLVGNQLSSASGNAVQLKGWSTFSTHFGEVSGCINENNFNQMKAWGANMVRIAMYLNEAGGYLTNKGGELAKMKKYIDDAAKVNMYILVDWHVLEVPSQSQLGNPTLYTKDAKEFFTNISSYVKEKGYSHVLYEICNEPDYNTSWSTLKSYAEEVIKEAIEPNDPDAIVICGTRAWDQYILEPAKSKVKLNDGSKIGVMYAFHYYACSHRHLVGDLSSATSSIPVFCSEWSGVKFDGDGNLCKDDADYFLNVCNGQNQGKTILSWAFWNWGYKNEGSSTFKGQCGGYDNLTKDDPVTGVKGIGQYIVDVMTNGADPVDIKKSDEYEVQAIPNTRDLPFQWGRYDYGGEGIAYHDGNGSLFKKDSKGNITGLGSYTGNCNEGQQYLTGDNMVPRPGEFFDGVHTITLSGGSELNLTDFPNYVDGDGCVDVSGCFGDGACDGGSYKSWENLAFAEPGEWINYTVDVAEPGYYSVDFLAHTGTTTDAMFAITLLGSNGGPMIRNLDEKNNYEFSQVIFPSRSASSCVTADDWQIWDWVEGYNEEEGQAAILFPRAGKMKIQISVLGAGGNVGPLNFTKVANIDEAPEDDPLFGTSTATSKVAASAATVYSSAAGVITINADEAGVATISSISGASNVAEIVAGENNFNVAAGVYVVNVNGVATKVIVK